MKVLMGIAALALLASCGADGEPIRPEANVSVNAGTGGVSSSVGVTQGPVSIRVGL